MNLYLEQLAWALERDRRRQIQTMTARRPHTRSSVRARWARLLFALALHLDAGAGSQPGSRSRAPNIPLATSPCAASGLRSALTETAPLARALCAEDAGSHGPAAGGRTHRRIA